MIYSNHTQKEKNLLDYLDEQDELPILEHQLKNSMREGTRAGVAVAFGMLSKATLFTQEMGIGKTFVAMGLIENILRSNPNKKVVFCGTNDKLNEYRELFNENLTDGWGITHTTAGKSQVSRAFREWDMGYRVLICTHSVWDKGHHFHEQLIPRLDQVQAFILDEGGMLLKSADNYSYRMMEQFVPSLPYRFVLDATPIGRDLTLLLNQCRILGIPIPSKSALFSKYGSLSRENEWVFGNLQELKESLKYHVFNVSRRHIEEAGEVNYILNTKFLRVPKEIYQLIDEDNARSLRYPFLHPNLFSPTNYPSLRCLLDVCVRGKVEGDHMLVYVTNVEPKARMKELLEELGLRVGIYDGAHTKTQGEKNAVEGAFNRGEYDVLLTNKLYGLSLSKANHVITYDLPPNTYQYVYRAVRDLNSKDLKVTTIVYNYPNDYNTLQKEADSERYQNEFSDRGFNLVKRIMKDLNYKATHKLYD